MIASISRSILTSCIGKSGSEDDLSGNNGNIKRPVSPNPGKPGNTWTGRGQGYKDEDDGFDDNYFRRRPKSFYFDGGRRMCGEAGSGGLRMSHVNIADENYFRSMSMVIYYDQTQSLITLILLLISSGISNISATTCSGPAARPRLLPRLPRVQRVQPRHDAAGDVPVPGHAHVTPHHAAKHARSSASSEGGE